MSVARIAFIGAGSVVFTKNLLGDILGDVDDLLPLLGLEPEVVGMRRHYTIEKRGKDLGLRDREKGKEKDPGLRN